MASILMVAVSASSGIGFIVFPSLMCMFVVKGHIGQEPSLIQQLIAVKVEDAKAPGDQIMVRYRRTTLYRNQEHAINSCTCSETC